MHNNNSGKSVSSRADSDIWTEYSYLGYLTDTNTFLSFSLKIKYTASADLCWFIQAYILQCCQNLMLYIIMNMQCCQHLLLYMTINKQYCEERFKKVLSQMKPKDKFVPYMTWDQELSGSIAPYTLYFCTRWRCLYFLHSLPPRMLYTYQVSPRVHWLGG